MRKHILVTLHLATAALLMLFGLGARPASGAASAGSPQPAPASGSSLAQTTTIHFGGVLGFHYNPNLSGLRTGDSLRWEGDFSMHPLVSNESLWPTPTSGSVFTYTFTTPGVYHWHCFFHGPIGMTGSVVVGYQQFLPFTERAQ